MIKSIINKISNSIGNIKKEKLNDFRLNKEQTAWILINQLRKHKIEIIEKELLNQIEVETSLEELAEKLKEFNLQLKKGTSENDWNYYLFVQSVEDDSGQSNKTINKKLNIGMQVEEEKNHYKLYTAKEEVTVNSKDIAYAFHIEKDIKLLDSGDIELEKKFSFSWFFDEMKKYKSLWKSIVVWSLLIQLLSFALPLMTQTIVDKVIVNQAQSTLISLIIGVFIFNLFNIGLSWSRQNMTLFIGNKIDNTLALKVVGKMFHLPLSYFQKRATGTIVNRVHAIESIREFISGSFVTLVLDIPFVFVFLVIMFYYSPLLTAVTLVFVALMVLLSIVVAPMIRKKALEQAKISGHNQAFITEYVGSIETAKSLQIENHLMSEFKTSFGRYLQKTKEARELAINYSSLMTWLEQTLNLLVLGIGAYLSMSGHEFTIGMLIAFQMFASRVTQPLLRISGIWQEFQQTQISMLRLKDIMDEKEENFTLTQNNSGSGLGKISIKNLGFKYEPHLPSVYENLNLNIGAKRLVIIQGPSGCGKSTLTKLLQGFYTSYIGNIEIDEIDIKQMGVVELRNNFGIVPQETTLFSGTILDNFKIVNPLIKLEEVVKLCQSVGIHDAISQLPEAYNTYLGEKGSGLSGGQKQRIAIARALSKKPKILIFDESVSSLDEISKKMVCDTIKKLNGTITIIFITHIDLGDVGPYTKIEMKKN